MAIKGKGKKKSRGPAARRRPAAAPRPVIGSRGHVPWYNSSGGRVALVLGVLIILGTAAGVIVNAQSTPEDEKAGQEALEDYTNEVRAVLQGIRPPASELSGAVAEPDGVTTADRDEGERLTSAMITAQTQLGGLTASAETGTVNRVFQEAANLYALAAQLYFDATKEKGDETRLALAQRVPQILSRADSLWGVGVAGLDQLRGDAGLDPSALGIPTLPQNGSQTNTTTEEEEGGGGGNKGKNDPDGGKKGDGKGGGGD